MANREINYAIHCTYKHITGATKGLKEFLSKIARVYITLITNDKLKDEDRALLTEISRKISKILKELLDISWILFKYEANIEKYSNEEILSIMQIISTYRIELEKILAKWIDFLQKKGYKEEDLTAHFIELHEVLADLYKIEQDHLPELLKS